MASTQSSAQVQACPTCGHSVDTAGLEPFGKVACPTCGHQLRVERVFENYVVVEPLGTGGMGSVYKARDTRLDRFVALKLLRKEIAANTAFTGRLQEEARITAAIKHPHVIEVYSVGQDHGQFYLVMELVDGGSLDDLLEDERRISELRTLEIGLQVAKGLEAALHVGLIHRDIKPGNILFAERGMAKIVDFGLAFTAAQHGETEGEIWGTPFYVAPERLTNGAPETFQSDLYSLGATLFHVSSGYPVFENETHSAMELKRLKSNPPSLQTVAPDISNQTAAVIDRMLRPNPAERQSSYRELIEDLEVAHAAALVREAQMHARRSWPRIAAQSVGVLLILALIGFGILFAVRHLPRKTVGPSLTPEDTTNSAGGLKTQMGTERDPQKDRYNARADEKARAAAQDNELLEKRLAEEKEREAEEASRWRAALTAERKALATYRFETAVVILEATNLNSTLLQAERDQELQRGRWLAEWKTKLISDINRTGFGGVVTDIHGMRYEGPLRRATPDKLELRTRYGSVMTDWLSLSPAMLLKISIAFIRPAVSDIPERQWLSAIFASQTGQRKAAEVLAGKAADANPEFHDLLPRFFPDAKN